MPERPTHRDTISLGLVAGEASGDVLAASLLTGLQAQVAQLDAAGIGGPSMQSCGFDAWWGIDALSVNGYLEVLREYPRLRRLRRDVRERMLQWRPDAFIGVDAPDFNLGLERTLRKRGLTVIQFIGPSIWAWRRGRIRQIGASVDHMLLLFPFEEALYRQAGIPATFVGHPLADAIPEQVDAAAARQRLGLKPGRTVVALLPGSRSSEIGMLAPSFLQTARWLTARRSDLHFVIPAVSEKAFVRLQELAAPFQTGETDKALPLTIVQGHAHDALAAAECVLVASGTASLEAALFRKPMVIAYRMNTVSYRLMKPMALQPWIGLPNILAGRFVVPEFIQDAVRAETMGAALLQQLEDLPLRAAIIETFASMHESLRRDCSARAAQTVLEVIDSRR